VRGTVRGIGGEAVPGATEINVWQADDEGLYDVQRRACRPPRARGELLQRP
jgi:protocatechuate 3,4-dioxygenase beta subunit